MFWLCCVCVYIVFKFRKDCFFSTLLPLTEQNAKENEKSFIFSVGENFLNKNGKAKKFPLELYKSGDGREAICDDGVIL